MFCYGAPYQNKVFYLIFLFFALTSCHFLNASFQPLFLVAKFIDYAIQTNYTTFMPYLSSCKPTKKLEICFAVRHSAGRKTNWPLIFFKVFMTFATCMTSALCPVLIPALNWSVRKDLTFSDKSGNPLWGCCP